MGEAKSSIQSNTLSRAVTDVVIGKDDSSSEAPAREASNATARREEAASRAIVALAAMEVLILGGIGLCVGDHLAGRELVPMGRVLHTLSWVGGAITMVHIA